MAAAAGDAEPRLDLCGVGFRFLELRVGLGGRNPDQLGTLRNRRAALDVRGDDASGGLGRDVGLLLGHQRTGRPDEARDRLLGGGDGRHLHDGRRAGLFLGLGVAGAAGADSRAPRRTSRARASEWVVPRFMNNSSEL